jgi:hypothetical protein
VSPRQVSLGARLARLGFQQPARAEQLLADPALAGLLDPLDAHFGDGLLPAIGEAPSAPQESIRGPMGYAGPGSLGGTESGFGSGVRR